MPRHLSKFSISNFSYKTLFIIVFFLLIAIVVLLKIRAPQKISAAWWNDNWHYRQAINISSHTNSESNVYVTVAINIGSTTKSQSDNGDFRFINQSGQILPYFVFSSAGTTAPVFHIQLSSFPSGPQTIYAYYGNSSVENGFSEADFSTPATNYTIGSSSSEETGGGPIAYWKFDEGVGTTAFDSTSNKNNGSITGATWQTEDMCVSGKCLNFNGSSDYINAGNSTSLNNINAITIQTWVKFNHLDYTNNTGKLLGFGSKGYPDTEAPNSGWWFSYDNRNNRNNFNYTCFGNSNGGWSGGSNNFGEYNYNFNVGVWYHLAVTVTTTEAKLYINGKQLGPTKTISNLQLSDVSKNLRLGSLEGFSTHQGSLDEFKIYPYARTAAQIKSDYAAGKAHASSSNGSSVNLGGNKNSGEYLSDGLVAYWKMDENIGTTTLDSSGKNTTGTFTGTIKPIWTSGKHNSGIGFSGVNDSLSLPYRPDFRNALTCSIWVKRTTGFNQLEDVMFLSPPNAWYFYDSYNSGNIHGDVFIDGVRKGALDVPVPFDNNWYHIVYTYDSASHIAKMYKNGVLYNTAQITGLSNYLIDNATGNLYNMGQHSLGRGLILDEARIYNRALSPSEISDLYNWNPSGNTPKTPIAHWKFDGNTDNSIATGSTVVAFDNGTISYTQNGKFNKALDFTQLASGSFTYIDNNTLRDSTKNWTTNQWVGYQFITEYNPGSQYCRDTINSNTATDITFSSTCNSFAGEKPYKIKKLIFTQGPVPNHSTTAITASLWFKSNGSQGARIARADNEFIHLTISNNDVSVGAISYLNSVSYATNPHDGKWHYLAIVYDGTTQKIYFDGVLRNSNLLSGTLPTNGSLTLGSRNDGQNEFFNGLIDEVKIYNTALTAEEIKLDYNQNSSLNFGSTNQTIGGTTTSLDYCIPGDISTCSSPVGEWKFDEGVGTSTLDTSGNNNSGIFGSGSSAPTWTQGKIGSALNFNGSNQYADAGNNASINISTAITLETWVKPNIDTFTQSNNTKALYLIDKFPGAYVLYVQANGNLAFYWYGLSPLDLVTYNYNLIANKWYHLAASYDGNGKAYLYLNGIQVASNLNITGTPGTTSNSLKIDGNKNFNGSLDQIRIYNYARTPAQIAYDYNKGAPIGHWKLDECQGNIAYDWSGIGNTGSINIGSGGSQTSVGTCTTSGTAWGNGASGKLNSSLNFDGTDDYVHTNSSSVLKVQSNTFSLWINAVDLNAYRGLLEIVSSSTGTRYSRLMSFGSNEIRYHISYSDFNGSYVSFPNVPLNKWVHLAGTWDGTTLKSYINGVKANETTFNSVIPYDGDVLLKIGLDPGRYFNGRIDDVRIYNYALTPAQIKTLYNNGAINFN